MDHVKGPSPSFQISNNPFKVLMQYKVEIKFVTRTGPICHRNICGQKLEIITEIDETHRHSIWLYLGCLEIMRHSLVFLYMDMDT